MPTPYTTISPAGLARDFAAIAHDATAAFGGYGAARLNWQPSAAHWSAAQCFDHLLQANHEMIRAIERALDRQTPLTLWQRLPLWPRLLGWMLVTSQAPDATRKSSAPATIRPATSQIDPAIVGRFVGYQNELIDRVEALTAEDGGRIMVSPFISRVTYSVLDGYRIIAAHQRRHFEQARRVTDHPGFPPEA